MSKRVTWNEENIAENKEYFSRNPPSKINEPKTPFHPNKTRCDKCGDIPVEYQTNPCRHCKYCHKCAIRLATGGRCLKCKQFFIGLSPISLS